MNKRKGGEISVERKRAFVTCTGYYHEVYPLVPSLQSLCLATIYSYDEPVAASEEFFHVLEEDMHSFSEDRLRRTAQAFIDRIKLFKGGRELYYGGFYLPPAMHADRGSPEFRRRMGRAEELVSGLSLLSPRHLNVCYHSKAHFTAWPKQVTSRSPNIPCGSYVPSHCLVCITCEMCRNRRVASATLRYCDPCAQQAVAGVALATRSATKKRGAALFH
jgi:hypothetical protein